MSLLRPDKFRIQLYPDKAIIFACGQNKPGLRAILPCAPSGGESAWRASLVVADQWVKSNGINQMSVSIVLSDYFVRYALMPFSGEVANDAEEIMLARILLEEIYGERANQWQLQMSCGAYGKPRLIAATDSALLDEITAVFMSGKRKLDAVVPNFVSVFDDFCGQIQKAEGLITTVETGLVVVAAFQNGVLVNVRRFPLEGSARMQLPELLRREALIWGLKLEALLVYLHTPESMEITLPANGEMVLHLLAPLHQGGSKLSDGTRGDKATLGKPT